jgi:hypothetical protein
MTFFRNTVPLKSPGFVESENFCLRILQFCLFREFAKCFYAYMENTANLGLFAVHTLRGKNICVRGEDAKIHKSEDILVNNGPT